MRLPDDRRLYNASCCMSHAEFGRNDHREDTPHFITSMIAAQLKSRISFLHRVPSSQFLRIDRGVQTLSISAHEMILIRALLISKNTGND